MITSTGGLQLIAMLMHTFVIIFGDYNHEYFLLFYNNIAGLTLFMKQTWPGSSMTEQRAIKTW